MCMYVAVLYKVIIKIHYYATCLIYYQDCVLLTVDDADEVSKKFLNELSSGSLSVNRNWLYNYVRMSLRIYVRMVHFN